MIHSEKAILRSLAKLTKSTDDLIYCDTDKNRFVLVLDAGTTPKSVPFNEKNILSMLHRLESEGYVTIDSDSGEIYFRLTLETIYRIQITFDRIRYAFFSKFIYGLISGIIVGASSTILAEYLTGLLPLT